MHLPAQPLARPVRPRMLKLAATLVAVACTLPAEPSLTDDLGHASLEELMNIEVSSVSRKQQRLSETAAAVFVINRDEIRRSGSSTIPELLRMVPGVSVARIDSSRYAITARGFNGRIANKMLVLVDGRTIYNNVYSGVFWEHFHIPVEDIERIEVIRGPGATVWGANAVNGVINIITAPAAETQGTMVTVGVGVDQTAALGVRYGGRIGKNAQYRIYGRHSTFRNQLEEDGSAASDGWHTQRMGFRLDWQKNDSDSFSMQGDLFRGAACQTVMPPLVGAPLKVVTDSAGGFGLVRWNRKQSERSEMGLQIYFNRENRSEYVGAGYFQALDFDFQHRYRMTARHDLVWGGGYRLLADDYSEGRPSFLPLTRKDGLSSSFVQDEIALVPEALTLTLGAKFQNNSYTGFEIQPGARLAWNLSRESSLWASVARAVRTPSRIEDDLNLEIRIPTLLGPAVVNYSGNRGIRSETLLAWEGGYRRQLANRLSLDVTGFTNGYDRLRGVEAAGPAGLDAGPEGPRILVPLHLANIATARTWGAEIVSNWNLADRWKVSANYTHLNGRVTAPDAVATFRLGDRPTLASPKHLVQMRSMFDITNKVSFDASIYRVSRLTDAGVPAYTRVDARIGWKINTVAQLSAGVTNLQSARHLEFTADDFTGSSRIRRSAYLRMTWRF